MNDLDLVSQWLISRLETNLISEVWIFGSAVHAPQPHNDVDVFIKYLDDYSAYIPNLRRETQAGFAERFGLPLHLLFLNHAESTEAAKFLESALQDGLRIW